MKKFLFYIIAFIILLATLLVDFRTHNWTLATLIATALIIWYYTYETYRLRLEAQKNTELNQTPTLVLRFVDSANPGLEIKNAGNVIAYNVNFCPFKLGEFVHAFYIENYDQYLLPGHTQCLEIMSLKKENIRQWKKLNDLMSLATKIEKDLIILVHYKNSINQKYYLIYRIYQKTKGVTSPALQFIKTGKGHLTQKEAEQTARTIEPQLDPAYEIYKELN